MTISTYTDLKAWFAANGRKGKTAPFWTLYGSAWASKETIVARNDNDDNMDTAYQWLEDTIRKVDNPAGQRFRIFQVDIPGGNNPVGQVYFQSSAAATPSGTQGIAGIGSGYRPEGYLTRAEVDEMLKTEREKMEMENRIAALESQLEEPADVWEKIMGGVERIVQTPVGAAIAAKLMGVPLGQPVQPVAAPPEEELTPDDEQFYNNIEAVAQKLGTSPHVLSAKLKSLVDMNPEMAAQILNGI